MDCLYLNCGHNLLAHDCSFRQFPSNDCQFRIWKRYASCSRKDIVSSRFPSLCSCHFIPGNEHPIPYYEYQPLKRKQSTNEGVNERNNELVNERAKERAFKRVNKRTNALSNKSLKPKIYRGKLKTTQIECRRVIVHEDLVNVQPGNEIDLSTEVAEVLPTAALAKHQMTVEKHSSQKKFDGSRDYTIIEESEILPPPDSDDTMDDVICTSDLIEKEIIEIKDDPIIDHRPMVDDPSSFGYEMIEKSDDQFFTYTGLPSRAMFDSVLDTLCQLQFNYVSGWNVNKIPMKNQLLMTLMKMRLDLRHSEVAERFKCSEATVSNVVRSLMVVMQDIIFLHEMKDIPTAERKNEELNACRIVEEMLRNEIERGMK